MPELKVRCLLGLFCVFVYERFLKRFKEVVVDGSRFSTIMKNTAIEKFQ